VLQVVDDALLSATEAQKKTSKDVDEKFKMAIEALNAYEKKYHFKEMVTKKMAEAEAKDKSSSATLNRLKENFRVKELALLLCRNTNADSQSQPLIEEPMKIVEFLLHRFLPDKSPTIVKRGSTYQGCLWYLTPIPEVLRVCGSSDLKETLWNFSRYSNGKRLTLKQNPHFYEVLPTSPEEYEGRFRRDPIKTFDHEKISVLTDSSGLTGRVFLETPKETRAFGNVWVPKDVIIFKGSCLLCFFSFSDPLLDVCGKLEGESIVAAAIQGIPNLWCFEEPPLSLSSRPALSYNRNSPSHTLTATQITSAAGIPICDWREPIRRMLRSQDVNLRFTYKPPSSSTPNYLIVSTPSYPKVRPFGSIEIPRARSGSSIFTGGMLG
jgi:hypothetical protein